MYAFFKLEHLELLTRVAPGLGQLLHNVVQGGQTNAVAHILLKLYLFAQLLAAYQVLDSAAQVSGHLGYNIIGFWVYGAAV